MHLLRPWLNVWSRSIVHISVGVSIFCNMASRSSAIKTQECDRPVDSCIRLNAVAGNTDKSNDMLFCGDLSTGREHIVYFGGDVQDFAENMLSHRDNYRHVQWSYEKTARLLRKRFPHGNIWIVRPSSMYLRTLSVFSNFVDCDEIGTPTFSEDRGAVLHLSKLLVNAIAAVTNPLQNPGDSCEAETIEDKHREDGGPPEPECVDDKIKDQLPITLIGFSKGCVVLNQILHELYLADSNEEFASQIARVVAFYWLDGGHVGNKNTWITSDVVLQHLTNLKVKLFVHVTPYQMEDQMRYWIAKEERKFVSKLQKLGADVMEKRHFEEEPRSIELHFRLLEAF